LAARLPLSEPMKLAWIPVVIAALAALLLVGSGAGVRLGLWEFTTGFSILRWSAYLGVAAALVALVLLAIPETRAGQLPYLLGALLLSTVVAGVPWYWLQQAARGAADSRHHHRHRQPAAFSAVIPLRRRREKSDRIWRRKNRRVAASRLPGHRAARSSHDA
jgi:hypothetical protein